MSLQRNIAAEYDFFNGLLEDLDPIDKKKLIGRFEVFQSGVSDLKKAAEGEEPLFSLEDEP